MRDGGPTAVAGVCSPSNRVLPAWHDSAAGLRIGAGDSAGGLESDFLVSAEITSSSLATFAFLAALLLVCRQRFGGTAFVAIRFLVSETRAGDDLPFWRNFVDRCGSDRCRLVGDDGAATPREFPVDGRHGRVVLGGP